MLHGTRGAGYGLTESDNWQPPDHERVYYRSRISGDLGYLCRYDGQECVQLDRPNEPIPVRFKEFEWQKVEIKRRLLPEHAACIAYRADQELCRYVGMHARAKLDWRSLSDDERAEWVKSGPKGSPLLRQRLFGAIVEALREEVG
jgi:hypothetical protein